MSPGSQATVSTRKSVAAVASPFAVALCGIHTSFVEYPSPGSGCRKMRKKTQHQMSIKAHILLELFCLLDEFSQCLFRDRRCTLGRCINRTSRAAITNFVSGTCRHAALCLLCLQSLLHAGAFQLADDCDDKKMVDSNAFYVLQKRLKNEHTKAM